MALGLSAPPAPVLTQRRWTGAAGAALTTLGLHAGLFALLLTSWTPPMDAPVATQVMQTQLISLPPPVPVLPEPPVAKPVEAPPPPVQVEAPPQVEQADLAFKRAEREREVEEALAGLAGFGGAHRRFEPKGEVAGVEVVDDYAHNAPKVAALVHAAAPEVVTAEGRVQGMGAVAPIINSIRDSSLRPEYVRTVAGWVGVAGYALVVGGLLLAQRRVNARYAPRHSRYVARHA